MKETHTTKLYWKKWSHKLVISLGFEDNQFRKFLTDINQVERNIKKLLNSSSKEHRFLRTIEYRNSDIEDYLKKNPRNTNYSPVYHHRLTIFFKDPEVFDLIKNSGLSHSLILHEKPVSANHLKALETEKCVVRKTLWFEKYRYCVRGKKRHGNFIFNPKNGRYEMDYTDDYKEMMTWFEEQFVKGKSRVADKDFSIKEVSSYYDGSKVNIFFAHAEDVMEFKLTWPDKIKALERIKLLSEIDDS